MGRCLLSHNLLYGFATFITLKALFYHLMINTESEQYFVFSAGQMPKKVSD